MATTPKINMSLSIDVDLAGMFDKYCDKHNLNRPAALRKLLEEAKSKKD
jgi:hypothetical protein